MQQNKPRFRSLAELNSPLHTASEQIQTYFNSLDPNSKKFPEIPHPFQLKPSPKHNCTKQLKISQKYYHCNQCSYDQIIDTMIYCKQCWNPKLHQGHTFQQLQVRNDKTICDCGRRLRLKLQSICQVHLNKDKNVEIKQDEKNKFIQYFTTWYTILDYLKNKQQQVANLQIALINCFINLCQDSLYYTRIIQQFIKKVIKMDKIFENPQYCPLLLQLMGDQKYILQIGEIFIEQEKKKYNLNIFKFSKIKNQLLNSQLFLNQMSKKGIYYPAVFQNYLQLVTINNINQQEIQNKIQNLFKILGKSINHLQYVDMIYQLFKRSNAKLIFNNQRTVDQILVKIFQNIQLPKENKQDKKQEKQSQNKRKIFKQMFLLNQIFYLKCQNRLQDLPKALEVLKIQEEKWLKIQIYIENFIKKGYFSEFLKERKRKQAFFVLTILQSHSKKSQLTSKIWAEVINLTKNFRDNLDKIYEFIAFFANSYRTFPALGLKDCEQNNKLTEIQKKQKLFKCYLYQNKQVSKQLLWTDYKKNWLKFPNCGKILNKLCKYNDDVDTFVYKGHQKHENNLMKIPLTLKKNWQNIRKMDINYRSAPFGESKILKNIFLALFSDNSFFNLYQQNFIKSLQAAEKQARTLQQWKTKGTGDNYVLILLIIDKLCHGEQNKQIKQEIQKIRNNTDQYRFRFTQIGSQQKIKTMLCTKELEIVQQKIQQKQQLNQSPQKIKSQQQIAKQQLKKKSQLKKQKLQNKMKQKQQNLLSKLKKDKSSLGQQQDDTQCLKCKQKQKKDKQFVYMVNLIRGDTVISKMMHGTESKTQTKISTNLHAIHMSCFQTMNKNNSMQFQCPLCKQDINCFLPYQPNKASKKCLQICWNVMNAVLVSVFDIYQTGSLFSVLLQSIVQSLGLTQLVYVRKPKSFQNMKHKADKYILQLLTTLYMLSSVQQKQKYKQIYQQFKKSIKQCKRKQLQNFQMLILQACFSRISGQGQYNIQLLQQLQKIMIPQEYIVLKKVLDIINDEQQTNQYYETSMQRISQIQIQQSPQKSRQKIQQPTSMQKIQQQQNKQKSQTKIQQKRQRISLGINILKPPIYMNDLLTPKLLGSKNTKQLQCSNCQGTNVQSACLLCHRVFCQNCQDDQQHNKIHLSNTMQLNLKSGEIATKKDGKKKNYNVYYNDFMIEYKKNNDNNQQQEDNDDLEGGLQTMSFLKRKRNSKVLKAKPNQNQICQVKYKLNQDQFRKLFQQFYNLSD